MLLLDGGTRQLTELVDEGRRSALVGASAGRGRGPRLRRSVGGRSRVPAFVSAVTRCDSWLLTLAVAGRVLAELEAAGLYIGFDPTCASAVQKAPPHQERVFRQR